MTNLYSLYILVFISLIRGHLWIFDPKNKKELNKVRTSTLSFLFTQLSIFLQTRKLPAIVAMIGFLLALTVKILRPVHAMKYAGTWELKHIDEIFLAESILAGWDKEQSWVYTISSVRRGGLEYTEGKNFIVVTGYGGRLRTFVC